MSKRVHFSSTNILYSPIPPTPSPTHSTSSLPSSGSPPTPPHLIYNSPSSSCPPLLPRNEATPFRQTISIEPTSPIRQAGLFQPTIPFQSASPLLPTSPLQPTSPLSSSSFQLTTPLNFARPLSFTNQPTRIHIVLAFSPSNDTVINYNLNLSPSSIINTTRHPSHVFSAPATDPPVPSLTVVSPHLPWPIVIRPSSPNSVTVTVMDIFLAIYRELRLAVHPGEYDALQAIGDVKNKVDDAYWTRCGTIGDYDTRQAERRKGVKRVDYLMGKTRFLGLSGTKSGSHIWELNVSE